LLSPAVAVEAVPILSYKHNHNSRQVQLPAFSLFSQAVYPFRRAGAVRSRRASLATMTNTFPTLLCQERVTVSPTTMITCKTLSVIPTPRFLAQSEGRCASQMNLSTLALGIIVAVIGRQQPLASKDHPHLSTIAMMMAQTYTLQHPRGSVVAEWSWKLVMIALCDQDVEWWICLPSSLSDPHRFFFPAFITSFLFAAVVTWQVF